MQQNDKNTRKLKEIRWGLSQKILGVILLLLLLYTIGTIGSAVLSNQSLGSTIDKKFDEAFNEVFTNVGNIFDDFEQMAKRNIRKTSGLFSLEKVWDIFLKGHEKYLENSKKEILMGRQGSLDNFEEVHSHYNTGMNKIADASARMLDEETKRQFLPLLEKTRKEMLDSENAFKKNEKILWDKLQKNLELDKKKIEDEVKTSSDAQIKDAIGKMGEANVVLVGSQETTRRQIEDIKYRAADSVKRSIQDSNRTGLITLASLIGAVTVLVIIISLFLTHSISRPISKMVEILQKMAKGELPKMTIVDVQSTDEIGMLASAFNEMTVNLQNVTASRDELNKEIAQRRKTEEELKEAYDNLKSIQAQLLQSEKMASIGQLAAGVAHEINNPLGFISNNMEIFQGYIRNYTQILRVIEQVKVHVDGGDWAKAKSTMDELKKLEKEIDLDYMMNDVNTLLEHSERGLERIQKIVMDLRTFAREDKTENIELIKVEEVMDSILSIVQNELKYKAELTKEYGKTPLVKGNAQRLGQVFINLLINASQAIEEKGKITIKTYQQDKYVYIDVIDTGKGISEENLEKIFDPFFTTKPIGQGTGLGLSVSYEIIKKHGGEIKVQSKLGEGTTFTVMLPIADND